MFWARINQKGADPTAVPLPAARPLHHSAPVVVSGVVLVAMATPGLAGGDLPRIWSILILVVGALHVRRGTPRPDRQFTAPGENVRTSSGA
jgi:hypothetical protein